MHIIRNYLFKEMIPPFILSIIIFTMILTMGNIIQMADLIINKGVGAFEMFQLVVLMMPSLLMLTIPLSVLSAVLLGFARLTSDNEIIALQASGVSIQRIAAPVISAGLVLSLACIPLNYNIAPESGYQARKLVKEIGVKNPTALLEPGVFLKIFKDYIIHIYDIQGNEFKNVRIYHLQENGPTRTIVAERGRILQQPNANVIQLRLMDGEADEIHPRKPDTFYRLAFETFDITLNLNDSLKQQKIEKKERELTISELREKLKEEKKDNKDVTKLLIEIHNKIAFAFSSLIFVLIAIPIGVKTHRREKSINFVLAGLLYAVYWAFMLGGIACAMRKFIPVWLGVWTPNIFFGIVSIVLFIRVIKR